MKKQAKDLLKGDKILLANQSLTIEEMEISDIGKQGKRKVRLALSSSSGEKVVVIRPEDYPFEVS